MDVLEKGQQSEFADFFDINWAGDKNEPLMVPFLGASLEEVIKDKSLQVVRTKNGFNLKYFDTPYPLNKKAQVQLQNEDIEALNSDEVNLLKLANSQSYRLCNWVESDSKINYRRFFTVNSLICLNIHHKHVFVAYHKYILSLLQQGIFQGLRVDHIDGLFDPGAYLEMLREVAGEGTYIIVEKILEEGEHMLQSWPIQGTTGYEFLASVNNLLVNRNAEHEFNKYYQQLTSDQTEIATQIFEKKRSILKNHMAGELDNLVQLFYDLELANEETPLTTTRDVVRETIAELLIRCPVYRYYGSSFPLSEAEQADLKQLLKSIEISALEPGVQLLKEVWIKSPQRLEDEYNEKACLFYQRCMQFSGPLMAKGVEDTLMYTYNRFIGKNEVGDSPEGFGKSSAEFHQEMQERQHLWPLSLNGTSTHDTKRGEDARARLQVLTDLHAEWLENVKNWQRANRSLKKDGKPDDNDSYFIYQTITGTHPMPGQLDESYQPRMDAYLEKALREAKIHTGWAEPDEEYESAAKSFSSHLLEGKAEYLAGFDNFHRKVSDYGIINALIQVVLKFTCPGIPDVYQGTELWDFSFVDPDNRRPVDYDQRMAWLKSFSSEQTLSSLWDERYSGKIKLWLEHVLLRERQQFQFTEAQYIPLKVKGHYENNVLAFARCFDSAWIITIVPLHFGAICEGMQVPFKEFDWKNTCVQFPEEVPENWVNLCNNRTGKVASELPVSVLFDDFPLAVLRLEQPHTRRGAGILMHITSLPSAFGIGDLGPEAQRFVRSLSRSNQKFWQILPLNPITKAQSYSPYSSISGMAGNTLLISPEWLEEDGLLTHEELQQYVMKKSDQVDYNEVDQRKAEIFDLAYRRFLTTKTHHLLQEYLLFLEAESSWLDDYVLFKVLRDKHEQLPWNAWPDEFKERDGHALNGFKHLHKEELTKEKWLQFVFFKQWKRLKAYARQHQVQLFGDLPFYISYDSVDVWSNRELFKLDAAGNKVSVAGVPPDYFNDEGQLWGMPIYRWDVMAAENYSWWKQRLRKNIEMYDLLRLDHFRAFSTFWEVGADEKTAINGQWMVGPSSAFFNAMKDEFGSLPFVAEDLGDISADVFELRDEFKLPGMKVLQFAFEEDMPCSIHIPHEYQSDNCIVYTGTHDNNTTKGWYKKDSNKLNRKNINQYFGTIVGANDVTYHFIRLAYSSVAKLAMVPMQDILGLGKSARMNKPSSTDDNWTWRMETGHFNRKHEKHLRKLTRLYGRY